MTEPERETPKIIAGSYLPGVPRVRYFRQRPPDIGGRRRTQTFAQQQSARFIITVRAVPVGDLVAGMAYLVRRLLENTSNESFLLAQEQGVPLERLLAAP